MECFLYNTEACGYELNTEKENRSTDRFDHLQYIFIDDPVTSLDENHIIEIAFDAFENKKYRDPDVLYPYLKKQIKDDAMYYILLDEVQLLGEFESILNSLIL